jgi:hypothetical protein
MANFYDPSDDDNNDVRYSLAWTSPNDPRFWAFMTSLYIQLFFHKQISRIYESHSKYNSHKCFRLPQLRSRTRTMLNHSIFISYLSYLDKKVNHLRIPSNKTIIISKSIPRFNQQYNIASNTSKTIYS